MIAIVGLAGRFAGAGTLEAFWDGLCRGVEYIRTLSEEELLALGVEAGVLADPSYVRRRGVLPEVDMFDANFFDMTAREAETTDPQQRVFLECAWEALEEAGEDPERYPGLIGVYAGASPNTYQQSVFRHRQLSQAIGVTQSELGNDADYLATRVSYKVNLRGPSMVVQTACSTSLTAVHLAVQSLLHGECDMALAGAVSIQVPQAGYHFLEGGIASPDGRCRAFDAAANGTVGGSGAGVVVLKRLADAHADGNHVYAVIRGTAVNNDGSAKVGFTAPSLLGQAEVIAEAQAVAGVDPRTITYLEAHGTGTVMGDPVEVKALTRAFRASTPDRAFCALGSVKANVGHLDAAAGAAGLIKVALAMHHGKIPPSLHFRTPNSACELEDSPFYVAKELRDWQRDGSPRRAGISSFGLGGTNAHAVLEEAPPAPETSEPRPGHLLLLTAATAQALDRSAARLADHLDRCPEPEQPLADVAHTLRVGRRQLEHRCALVCEGRGEAIAALRVAGGALLKARRPAREPAVVFMFPGQGSQHAGMGRGLYEHEPVFRSWVDRCSQLLAPDIGLDLRSRIYAAPHGLPDLEQTWLAQPALFVTAYALARTLMEWGIRPDAMTGHSLGEYVAACLADVFSLEDCLRLIALRGRLMQERPGGSMAAVAISEEQLRALLPSSLSLAAVNGPFQCVVSGPAADLSAFQETLNSAGIRSRRLHTSHAFHSRAQDPVVAPVVAEASRIRPRPPRLRLVSNVTGDWMTAAMATDSAYWGRQLRDPVRFADGLQTLTADPDIVLLEVGPGTTLGNLARQQPGLESERVVAAMRHPEDPRSDRSALLSALARLWLAGVPIDWAAFGKPERRRLVSLPTYPFERQSYWIAGAGAPAPGGDGQGTAPELSSYPRPDGLQAFVAPAGLMQERVAGIWRELVGTDRIGAADNFFELGGNSLSATQMLARLGETFGVELPIALVFDQPTVAGLAAAIEDELIDQIEALPEEEVERLEAAVGG